MSSWRTGTDPSSLPLVPLRLGSRVRIPLSASESGEVGPPLRGRQLARHAGLREPQELLRVAAGLAGIEGLQRACPLCDQQLAAAGREAREGWRLQVQHAQLAPAAGVPEAHGAVVHTGSQFAVTGGEAEAVDSARDARDCALRAGADVDQADAAVG